MTENINLLKISFNLSGLDCLIPLRELLMNNIETDIIELLRTFINDNGISQRQLADSLGISEAAVSRYFSYQRIPNKIVQNKIKKILGSTNISFDNKDICSTKKHIEQLIRENINYYNVQERLQLISIIAR
jgi:predicted transcriptional regulator